MGFPKRILPTAVLGIALVCAWQTGLLHSVFGITTLQLPLPSQILSAFSSHIENIGQDAVTTVGPAILGLILGALSGYIVALIVTAHPVGANGMMILVTIINAVPIIALAPLMNRWFTIPFLTKLAVIIVASSGAVAVHAAKGLADVDSSLNDLMKSCAADKGSVLLTLRIPNSLPSLFSGLKIAVSSAMMATIISEFFSKETSGLGYMIKHSLKVGNQKPLGWAYIFAMFIMSLALYGIVCAIERNMIRWHVSLRQ